MVTFYEGPSPEGEGHTSNSEKGRAKVSASSNKTKGNYTKPDAPSIAQTALEIDLSEAARFLNLLDEGATEFTFQTFDDNADRQDRKLTRILHGTLEEHAEILTRMNNLGAGIYVMVQQGDGRGRRNENVTRIRAVFQEDDGEGRRLPLDPHIVNQTSPGKYQRYLLTDGPSVEEFSAVQECLIANYGSDKNAKDPAQVLRLPGFYHQKVDSRKGLTGKPFMVRIVHESGALPYTREQMLKALPPIDRKGNGSHTAGEGTVKIEDCTCKALRSALAFMRADDRGLWVRMGHALKELGDVGRGLWLEWSQTSLEKYDSRDAAQKWESFKPEHTGYRAVFAEAQRQGWVNPATGEKKEKVSSPLPKLTHAVMLFREHWKERLKFNQLLLRQELDGKPLSDADLSRIRLWLEEATYRSFGKEVVCDAVDEVCDEGHYDPLVDYLDSLVWDGEPRLATWLTDIYGAEHNEYTSAVGKCWLISGVARAYEPGVKVRNVLLLQGPEEIGKSLSLTDLCPNRQWFTDSLPADLHSKEAAEALFGKWIVESAEMASMRRSAQEAIKAFLSRDIDNYRAPYARKPMQVARRCILVATTNHDDVLSGEEENTRFWPVRAIEYNRDYLLANRDQLWAEAKDLYKAGARWWLTDKLTREAAKQGREAFEKIDPWFEWIEDLTQGRDEITVRHIAKTLEIPLERLTDAVAKRIAQILRKLKFKRTRARRKGGRSYVFVREDT
jgi:predicted P-loop ATPase